MSSITTTRTTATNPDYQSLLPYLDAELKAKDGDEHPFYAQYNKSDEIKHVLVAYKGEVVVGCGAIKAYEPGTMEVKRMYVSVSERGKGIASHILKELELWATELGNKKLILETGALHIEPINLYKKNNYITIPNYGQYAGKELSVCMMKEL